MPVRRRNRFIASVSRSGYFGICRDVPSPRRTRTAHHVLSCWTGGIVPSDSRSRRNACRYNFITHLHVSAGDVEFLRRTGRPNADVPSDGHVQSGVPSDRRAFGSCGRSARFKGKESVSEMEFGRSARSEVIPPGTVRIYLASADHVGKSESHAYVHRHRRPVENVVTVYAHKHERMAS